MKLLEAIFRRFIRLLLILFVPIIIGVGITYVLPTSYQASAKLWALRPYQSVSSTSTQSSTTDPSPAGTQSAGLTELLKSRSFDSSVGKSTNLKSTLNVQDPSNSAALDDAYLADLSKNVQVSAQGNNSYQITYTNANPGVAAQVVGSVITQFQTQGQQFTVIDGQSLTLAQAQNLLQQDQVQLTKASNDVNTTASNMAAYLAAHPGATLNDPQYALLDAQHQQAQSTLQNLQSSIATLNQEITVAQNTNFFKTLDPPVTPQTSLRSKLLVTTVGIGAAVGLVVCILYILVLVRRDRAFYTARDVEKVTSYPILMQVPQLSQATSIFFVG